MTSKTLEAQAAGQIAGSQVNEQEQLIKQLLMELSPQISLLALIKAKEFLDDKSELDTGFLRSIINERETRFEREMRE